MPEPIPFDQVTASKKPAGLTLELIDDSNLTDAVNRALARQAAAQKVYDRSPSPTTTANLADADEQLATVRAEARDVTKFWRFVAIGREPYEELRDAHPSTKDQRADYRKKMAATGAPASQIGQIIWNTETFPPALISASCAGVFTSEEDAEAAELDPDEPYMSVEQATALWNSDRYNSAELDTLFSAALLINSSNRTADLGND